MEKEQLELLIETGQTIRGIAHECATSPTNVRYWLKKHGLRTKSGPGGRLPKDMNKPRRCACGETNPINFYGNKGRACRVCHNAYTQQVAKKKRARALSLLGGKCTHCGWDLFMCSLDFHHKDPSKKDPNFRHWRGWAWKKLEEELQQCCLLCKNCHAAVHAGVFSLGA